MNIVFFGTPDPAARCLQALIDSQETISLAVSQPDRKKGRGLEISATPVKLLAQKHKIEVLSPEKVKDQGFIEKIKAANPDLIVIVAFGRILPKEILSIPKYGAINVHASLLPKYRGAAPIQWAIFNGEKETGVTIMYLNETLDTGDIILQEKVLIDYKDNSITLSDKLFDIGSSALLKAITQIKGNAAKRIPQDDNKASYASIITKKSGEIDWRKPAEQIYDQIRAFVPWPTAYTFFNGKILKIWEASMANKPENSVPGEIFFENNTLKVSCGKQALHLLFVQAEGGKKLPAQDFARGHNLISKKILPS